MKNDINGLRFDYLLTCAMTGLFWGLVAGGASPLLDVICAVAGSVALFTAGFLGRRLWSEPEPLQASQLVR